jgi:hypothetical protein
VRASGEADALGGTSPRPGSCGSRLAPTTPDDVWIYVQAGIEYRDIGNHAGALEWLTTGLELALRTGDPEAGR